MTTRDIGIVGAGAAGIWTAWRAAEETSESTDVVLLEKTPRVGTKILASGGQKCNLTTTLGPRDAGPLYGDEAERFLRYGLWTLQPSELRRRFDAIGVPTKEAHLQKIFPESERAVDVRDALERETREAGVEIRLERPVQDIRFEDGEWTAAVDDGRNLRCRRLLCCPGGMSYPGTGTTGDGYEWMTDLGLDIVEPVPDLVGLLSPADWVHELAGVDVQTVEAQILDGEGRILARRRRPIVFTHQGISGPGAMDLAEHVTRPRTERPDESHQRTLALDLYPDIDHDDLRAIIVDAASSPGACGVWSVLPDGFPRSVFRAACQQIGLSGKGLMIDDLTADRRNKLIHTLKRLCVPLSGSEGFEHAEVTAGGVALEQIDPESMRVNGIPQLYVFGEILDATGPIGGLNFQAAWSEAEVAALAVAEDLSGS